VNTIVIKEILWPTLVSALLFRLNVGELWGITAYSVRNCGRFAHNCAIRLHVTWLRTRSHALTR